MKAMQWWIGTLVCAAWLSGAPVAGAAQLVVNGSTTVYPIVQQAAAEYARANPHVEFEIVASGSGNGIKALIDGTTHIASSSRFIKDKEVQMAMEKGVFPVAFRVAYDCIVPVVHPGNPVENLTMGQLKQIFQGTIRDWGELGGSPGAILVVSRDPSSGTFEVWHEKVMHKEDFIPSAALRDSNQKLMEAVAQFPQAIGYVGLGYVNPTVKAVRVDGIEGTELTALDGSFPVSRPLFMFTSGYPEGETLKFINYILEPGKGQKFVKLAGFVSLYEPQAETAGPVDGARPAVSAAPQDAAPAAYGPTDTAPAPQGAAYPDYLRMSWREKVGLVQKHLSALQYPVGPVDSLWGPRTYAAVMQYQQDNRLPADGNITFQLLRSMESKTRVQ